MEEKKEKINPLKVTEEEESAAFDKLEKATFDLLDEQPFVGHLIQKLTRAVSKEIPTACVFIQDGKYSLMVNPKFFCEQGRKEAQAILKHEIYHLLNEHLKRMEDKDRKVWNVAADLAINQYIPNLPRYDRADIKKKLIEKGGLTEEEAEKELPKADADGKCCMGLKPEHYKLPLEKTAEWYYEKVMSDPELKDKFQQKVMRISGNMTSMSKEEQEKLKEALKNGARIEVGSGDHENWDTIEGETREILDEELKRMVRESMEQAGKDFGNLPNGMQQTIIEFLTTKVNWKAQLRAFVQLATQVKIAKSRKRPNRRYGPTFPGNKSDLKLKLGVAIDTSGSISQDELSLFAGEINRIFDAGCANITIVEGDAIVHRIYPLKRKFKSGEVDFHGRGGTNAQPWLDALDKERVDAAVILTDGYFGNVKKPKAKVLWALTETGYSIEQLKENVKFGRCVKLETEKKHRIR